MRRPRAVPHFQAGAYAMDALTSADKARFERHLARCQDCAGEIRGYREVAVRLAGAAAAPPSQALKERVLSAAAHVRQLPPATGPVGTATMWPSRRPWAAGLALAAGGGLFLAAIFGLIARDARHQLSAELRRSGQIAEVLTARDAITLDARIKTGGTAAIVMSPGERALVFAATGLRVLPSSECYELWLIGPGGDTPAGMLPAPREGSTGPVIAADLAAGDRLGLSVEPAGGSRRPTSPMVLELAL